MKRIKTQLQRERANWQRIRALARNVYVTLYHETPNGSDAEKIVSNIATFIAWKTPLANEREVVDIATAYQLHQAMAAERRAARAS